MLHWLDFFVIIKRNLFNQFVILYIEIYIQQKNYKKTILRNYRLVIHPKWFKQMALTLHYRDRNLYSARYWRGITVTTSVWDQINKWMSSNERSVCVLCSKMWTEMMEESSILELNTVVVKLLLVDKIRWKIYLEYINITINRKVYNFIQT